METVYWAAKPTNEIVEALRPKVDAYYEHLRASGSLSLWAKAHRQYYSGLFDGGQLGEDGEQGELVSVNCNDFRNLCQHLNVMTTSQRPAFEPRAQNSDHKSQTQTILAAGLLDYVLKEKKLERLSKRAVTISLLFGDGCLRVDWDANRGKDYAANEEGTGTVKTGDLAFRLYSPLDMVSDFTKTDPDEHQWRIGRHWINRWDLAAAHPNLAEAIVNMPTTVDRAKRPRYVNMTSTLERDQTDDVEVFEFIHDRTPAMPDGRLVKFILDAGETEPLFDGPLPFDDLSVYSMSPEAMEGTSHSYSPVWDLLSLQQAANALWTTLASNVSAFGVQNLWTSEGDNLAVSSVSGLRHIQSRVKPEGLNLVANSPDTYKLLELVTKAAETISGVNSVARGNPEASLKSGAALALVQAQALQFSIGLQQAYVQFMEGVATGVIRIYKRFAKAPQVALIVGRANKGFVQEFKGDDLSRIERVAVDLGNPLQRTVAGRVQVAESLLEKGLIKTPEEYIQVLSTGKLEPVLEATQKEMLAIKAENERLAEAAPEPQDQPVGSLALLQPQAPPTMTAAPNVIAMLTDNHPAHIREHAAVISSPDARDVPGVVERALSHIQEHIDLWQTMPPALAMALQIPPPPMLQPMGPPDATGAPPPGAADGTLPPEPGPMSDTLAPPQAAGDMPNMPQMPVNPLSGERAPGAPLPT